MAEPEKRTNSQPEGGAQNDRSSESTGRPRRRSRRRVPARGGEERATQRSAPEAAAKESGARQAGPNASRRSARPDTASQQRPSSRRTRSATSTSRRGGESSGAGSSRARQPRAAAAPAEEQRAPQAATAVVEPDSNKLVLPDQLTVRELAALMKRSPIDLIKELMRSGFMANINQQIDFDTAAIVADEMGFTVEHERGPEPEEPEAAEEVRRGGYTPEEYAALPVRPPVVTVLGHVDHGKTTLLDAIRQANVAAGEAGGITQHIGAYQVEKQGKLITFLDTPGHEAFTAMRARGAKVTDLAILVVAADDGVMPQTLEAIDHARAAQVPIIIALNKIDRESANPDLVKQQLADADLVVEDYGGEVILVPVSAKQRIGIENLLEMILLVAEMIDVRADPSRPALGAVIEGRLDKARGPMATLLIQDGTLRAGDSLVISGTSGRVRAMFDSKGQRIDAAPPSTPVAVLGLPEVPEAGSSFKVVEDDRTARALASDYAEAHASTATQAVTRPMTLEEIYARAAEGQIKSLNLILKADVQGTIEPIESSLSRLGDENLKVELLLKGTGNITESDVSLAIASDAIVIGFSVQVDPAAARLAEANGVDIRVYDIIYRLTEDIDKALKGLLEPVFHDVTIGRADVRATFHIPRVGTVAGGIVTDGIAARNAQARVLRAGEVIYDGNVSSLKRYAEDVREATAGHEFGVGIEGFGDYQTGDVIEFYRRERES
jgi:translation initiation factor IF-2